MGGLPKSPDRFGWKDTFGWWFTLSVLFSLIALAPQVYHQLNLTKTVNVWTLSQDGELIPAAVALWIGGLLRGWQGHTVIDARDKVVRDIVTVDFVASLFFLLWVLVIFYASIVDKQASTSTVIQSWILFGSAAIMNGILALAATKPS